MANIREGLLNLVSGAPNSPYRGLLSPEASNRARNTSLTDASIAMMLGSTGAPGAPAPTFMQALAGGLQAGRKTYGQVADAELLNRKALQQINTSQRTQAGQEALARHFAVNPITPDSLKTGARIAASFGDMATYKALLEQIATITPEPVEAPKTTDDLIEYDRDVKQGYIGTFRDYMKSKETPTAAAKADRIPQDTIADIIITRIDPVTGEIVKTPAGFGMTFKELEALELQEGVAIESRTRIDEAAAKTRKEAARDTDIDLLSNDLLSVERLLTGGNTGGRVKSFVGYLMNDNETAELGNLYAKLKAQFTLKELASAKDKGVTFGALSDGERIMVAESIGRLEQTQDPELQRLELSRIVGAFARHGLVDTSGFSPAFLNLAEKNAREGLAELPTTTSSAKSTGSVAAKYGLEQ
jgi:hypothetical protein